jgi:uncharacterized protein
MPIVTSLYASLSFLLLTVLGANVSRARAGVNVWVGPVPESIARPHRAHGNAAEWIPALMGLLLLLELTGLNSTALHVLGGASLAARLLHAGGFLSGKTVFGAAGSMLNYGLSLTMSLWLLVRHFSF